MPSASAWSPTMPGGDNFTGIIETGGPFGYTYGPEYFEVP